MNSERVFSMSALPSDPVQSPQRLAVLDQTYLLGSDAEPTFDRLTKMAARLLDVPVALISLVGQDHQFFKSQTGLTGPIAESCRTPLDQSFCKHVVADDEPLIVRDARIDPRVSDNGAIEALNVIAYAGVPLRTSDGHVLGSLCAICPEPRDWSDEDVAVLEQLADSAMQEIELRRRLSIAEEDNARYRRQLENQQAQSNNRDELFAVLGHELRNNIGPAMLAAEMLSIDDRLPRDMKEDVASIRRSLEAEASLVGDMVDVARMIRGQLRINRQPTDINELIREIANDFRTTVETRGLTLDVQTCPDHVELGIDPLRLRQVVVNLLNNAAKFTDKGTIRVTCTKNDRSVAVAVADTGCGMDRDRIERLFVPMSTSNENKRSGLGLGLTICRGVIEAHGGTINARSDGPGHGSTFTFTLPR